MRVIDCHVHLYPDEANRNPSAWALANGESAWATMCTRRRKNGTPVQTFPDVDELLRVMDAAGVERSVLLGWYWQRSETCAQQNRFYAECVRSHPSRLSAFATVQPRGDRAAMLDDLRRARDEGLIGLGELSPHAQGYAVSDAGFQAALALAAAWGWPVNLHVTDPDSRDFPGRVETPLEDFVALARLFPAVRFILAHWGGLLPLRDATTANVANLYYDTAASPLLYDDSVWQRFLTVVGEDHVLFGSDYPLNVFPKLETEPGMKRLIAEAKQAGVSSRLLAGTAAGLLGL